MTAKAWNETHPVGTRVRYWPLPPASKAASVDTKTRSEAWTLTSGHVVVLVAGISGCVSLSHLEVIDTAEEATT